MSLVPVAKRTGRKRSTSEHEKGKLRREQEKSEWHRRNPDSKWNKR